MSVNKEGLTALHLASSAGSLSCIQVKFGLTNLLHVDFDTLHLALVKVGFEHIPCLQGGLIVLHSGAAGRREGKTRDVELGRPLGPHPTAFGNE